MQLLLLPIEHLPMLLLNDLLIAAATVAATQPLQGLTMQLQEPSSPKSSAQTYMFNAIDPSNTPQCLDNLQQVYLFELVIPRCMVPIMS